ncbi:GNAT family N-acetyltransferase [Cohnella fermenti]|uniref:GNAT family N-acetyltransferase n=1 Tax=Cohnella fermenti TaxID=2565925 RepID=A0A4S4BVW3_9BACL|nr:GNAT family N-acetyltransferase [Cohnella fermenti]THF77153.1 GNAT family N-acetyltransferase [Cohnella fermenti]
MRTRQAVAIPEFRIGAMTEEDGADIAEWRYPPPYHLYRWPSWERMVDEGLEFGDPHIRARQYVSIRNEEGELIGYAQFFPMVGVVRLGLGLRPDCCDRGWGTAFAEAIAREAARRSPNAEIDLEVETWNKRAIRTYKRAGFKITDKYKREASNRTVTIYCMKLQA